MIKNDCGQDDANPNLHIGNLEVCKVHYNHDRCVERKCYCGFNPQRHYEKCTQGQCYCKFNFTYHKNVSEKNTEDKNYDELICHNFKNDDIKFQNSIKIIVYYEWQKYKDIFIKDAWEIYNVQNDIENFTFNYDENGNLDPKAMGYKTHCNTAFSVFMKCKAANRQTSHYIKVYNNIALTHDFYIAYPNAIKINIPMSLSFQNFDIFSSKNAKTISNEDRIFILKFLKDATMIYAPIEELRFKIHDCVQCNHVESETSEASFKTTINEMLTHIPAAKRKKYIKETKQFIEKNK
eukprot:Pgem_evm1s18915